MRKHSAAKWAELGPALVLIGASIGLAVVFAVAAARRQLTSLESTVLQGVSLVAGLVGSYVFGRFSSRKAAAEMVRPHARSAFRRVLGLYWGLSRLAGAIERARTATPSAAEDSNPPPVLDTIEAIVVEQVATAGDSLEDWRDIIPEEVEEVESRVRSRQSYPSEGLHR
jgi:hypothetical protein